MIEWRPEWIWEGHARIRMTEGVQEERQHEDVVRTSEGKRLEVDISVIELITEWTAVQMVANAEEVRSSTRCQRWWRVHMFVTTTDRHFHSEALSDKIIADRNWPLPHRDIISLVSRTN